MDLLLKLGPGVQPGNTSADPHPGSLSSWVHVPAYDGGAPSLSWGSLGRYSPAISASHGSMTRCPLQLVHFIIHPSDFFLKWTWGPWAQWQGPLHLNLTQDKGCQWPWWIAWSCSFCPVASVWANIYCSRNGWWIPCKVPTLDICLGKHQCI